MADPTDKRLLITGVSSGLGRALAEGALKAGHRVAGTVRREADRQAFEALSPSLAAGYILDQTDFAAVPAVIADVERRVGPINVLVNNAGFGHEGLLEETSLTQFQAQFDANLFGVVALIQAVLPGMRARRGGHIINVTSAGGIRGVPGLSAYCASKFALEGLSESLAREVAQFGVHVTALAPGSFRTDWAGRSLQRTKRHIADYDAFMAPLTAARQEKSGKQPGDPVKAAQAFLALIDADRPPLHLILGSDGLDIVQGKIARLQQELAAWEGLSRSTDCDG